jgi:hypothetical protein
MFGGRMQSDSFAKQIQLAFPFLEEPLASRNFLQLSLNGPTQPLDFRTELGALKIEPETLECFAPAGRVSAFNNAVLFPLG